MINGIKNNKNSPYQAKNITESVKYLQSLLNTDPLGGWTKRLNGKEVTFVYDMVSRANSFKDFTPSAAQSEWMIAICSKIKLEQAAYKQRKGTGKKKNDSVRADHTSKKSAIRYCESKGVSFERSTPRDVEVAKALYEMGEINKVPTKKIAMSAIVSWYLEQGDR